MEDNSNIGSPAPKHKRRVRYRGKHPRRFEEKYKELNPVLYPDEIQKVISAGKTPAGSHRSICVREIMEVLRPQPGETAVDATLGFGGHAEQLMRAISPSGRFYGVDVDPIELPKTEARLRALAVPLKKFTVQRMNFAGTLKLLAEDGVSGADVILADLGLSSMQIDNPRRGFTFKVDGPLDLRMNPERGQSAAQLLCKLDEGALTTLFIENSDEPNAGKIAAAIAHSNRSQPITTTKNLSEVIRSAFPAASRRNEEVETSIRRIFQALRIAVNDEFSALETFLRQLPSCLNPDGRVAILTFHSGEDRRVKKAFQAGKRDGLYSAIADDVIRPSPDEMRSNPRSTSAKLRWAIRTQDSCS